MATLYNFPGSARQTPPHPVPAPVREPAANLPATGGRGGEYALADIARPLGLLHRPIRTIIDTLRALAKHDGMPLPRTPRVERDKVIKGPNSIVKASRWDAGLFDAWLDGRGPQSPAPAMVPTPIREEMQARARAIGGGR